MRKLSAVSYQLSAKKGTVLILTFIVMAALVSVTAAFLYMTAIQTKGSGYDIAGHKALWIAEGGLQQVMYNLKTNPAYRSNPTPLNGSLGDGSYTTTITKVGDTFTVTSTGTVYTLSRKITQTAEETSAVLDRAIHADGSIIHFDGSTGTINGNISCHVQILGEEGMTINGTVTEDDTMVNPTVDFDYYKTLAQEQGHYYTTALTFQSGTYTGVWYTTKQVTIGDNAIIEGSVIAESQIKFTDKANNIYISPANNYPALASQTSIISSGTGAPSQRVGLQNSVINGLIVGENDVTFDYMKNNTINGTILAGNNISMQNGSGIIINYNADIFTPMPPGFTFSGGELTVIPQKDWNEIVPAI